MFGLEGIAMMQQVIQSLQNGMNEGIYQVNSAIDNAVYIDPENQADAMAEAEVQKEVDKENSRIDKINTKVDDKIADTRQKVDEINQSFDQGVAKTKEKIKEVSCSDFMQVYRAARMVYWGKLAADYVKTNPDWLNNFREFGNSAATRLKQLGIEDATDSEMTETDSICARRDAMFGSPDAGIEPEMVPTTEAILAGADIPLESISMMEIAMG